LLLFDVLMKATNFKNEVNNKMSDLFVWDELNVSSMLDLFEQPTKYKRNSHFLLNKNKIFGQF